MPVLHISVAERPRQFWLWDCCAQFQGQIHQVDTAAIPGRDLNTHKTEGSCPLADIGKIIEGCFVTHELSKEDGRSFDGSHMKEIRMKRL